VKNSSKGCSINKLHLLHANEKLRLPAAKILYSLEQEQSASIANLISQASILVFLIMI